MKRLFGILLTISFALTACATDVPDPVQQYQRGDRALTCEVIHDEIQANQVKILALTPRETGFAKGAVFKAAASLFSNGENEAAMVEVKALQVRNSRLRVLFHSKNCKGDPHQPCSALFSP